MDMCEYADSNITPLSMCVKCTITNDYCGMVRYCTEKQRPVMTNTFTRYGCKIRNDYGAVKMSKKKRNSNTQNRPKKVSQTENGTNTVVCKVNYSKNGKTSVLYAGEGKQSNLFIDGEYSGMVEITYKDNFCSNNIVKVEQIEG